MTASKNIAWPLIALGLFSCLIPDTLAQAPLLISGKVIDIKTRLPLSYASLTIAGKPVGTITNAEGAFDFHVPPDYAADTLIVSHVGYETFRKKIDELRQTNMPVIALQAASLSLKEVVIEGKELSGKEIVIRAIENLTTNYPTGPFCLEGFFREIEEENGKYVLLTEAAIDLCDKKFDGRRKKLLQESVDIKEMRRSLHYSWRASRDNIGFALADLLENNDVRYNRGMLDTTNTFSLDTIILYHDRPVYGVAMASHSDRGMLYIDMETFGILKVSMERKSHDPGKRYYYVNRLRTDSLKMGRVWFRFSVEFENYEGKLYPRRMHESELNEIYNAADGRLNITLVETLELIVHKIQPGQENKNARRMRYGLAFKPVPYNAEFWKHYNTLKLTPVNEKLIRDLEKEISLQEQYQRNIKTDTRH